MGDLRDVKGYFCYNPECRFHFDMKGLKASLAAIPSYKTNLLNLEYEYIERWEIDIKGQKVMFCSTCYKVYDLIKSLGG